jgi:hypothetical protein
LPLFHAVKQQKQTTSEEQMKFNKWTLSLAALGAVSFASAAHADEATMSAVQTALSNTTISGYVSASANWQLSPSDGSVPYSPAGNIPFQGSKANGFNLDVVKLSISKPQDESEWASGYQVDLWMGPDAVGWNPAAYPSGTGASTGYYDGWSDFAIQQAYIALRTPVGNGIDWKVGVFNTVVGYESADSVADPNYTRSWGWSIEPTEHTGILGTYMINDEFSVSGGVANTLIAGINARNGYDTSGANTSVWHKTALGSATFTAPSDWGWAAGSAFYAGFVWGWAGGTQGTGTQAGNQVNYYAGATLNSPWKDVTFGAAFDYVQNLYGGTGAAGNHNNVNVWGLYNTIKATDKLSFNTRGELWGVDNVGGAGAAGYNNGVSLTETVQYDLWANVISRLEFRYDHGLRSNGAGAYVLPNGVTTGYVQSGSYNNERTSYGLYANLIYKF